MQEKLTELIEIGARNRYEGLRRVPWRSEWPSWEEATEQMRATYRMVFAEMLAQVRTAETQNELSAMSNRRTR